MMTDWEYIDDGHIYTFKGEIKPSVTQLVNYATGNIYKNVPARILEQKAKYGTYIHEVIQNYVTGKKQEVNDDDAEKLADFIIVTDGVKFIEAEKMVAFEDRYAGRLDLMDKDGYIYDIKTTAKLHRTSLEWQIGLYYLASGKMKRKGFCIWLPKGKEAKLVEIKPKTKTECLELLKRYEADCEV